MTAIASRNFGVRRSFIVLTAALYLAGFPFYAASASTIPPLQLTCKYEWEDYDDRTTFGVVDLSFLTGSGQPRVTARFDGKDEEQAAIRLIEANLVAWIVDYRGSTGEIEYRFNFEKRTGIFKGAHGFGLLYNCSQKQ